ncbi:MAG: SpoIIE family protein phosphatase [Oscillospiraceae bacterium]
MGTCRQNNEDNFSVKGKSIPFNDISSRHLTSSAPESYGVVGVFDGMGGEQYGEIASSIAAQLLPAYTTTILNDQNTGVTQFLKHANKLIEIQIEERRAKMGTTAVIASYTEKGVTFYNLGDSRAYLLSGNRLLQCSYDDTVAQQMVSIGLITPQEALADKRKHQLTQHLGIASEEMTLSAHCSGEISVYEGDCFLLCSDGVTDALSDTNIAFILSQKKSSAEIAEDIVMNAMINQSKDNVTAIVVKVQGGESKPNLGGDKHKNNSRPVPVRVEQRFPAQNPVIKKETGKIAALWILCDILALALGAACAILKNVL